MLTREAVVQASLELGQTMGEDGLTMRALASRLGVSATSLYGIFEGKDAILRELRVGAWNVLAEALRPVLGIRDRSLRLRAVCRAYLDFARDNAWLYDLAMQASLFDDDMSPEQAERASGPARVALAALRDGADDADEATLRLRVIEVWAALHGLATLSRSGRIGPGTGFDPAETNAFVDAYVDALVAGLGGPRLRALD